MSKILDSIRSIRLLDELSEKKTLIHLINPIVKLIVTLVYIIFIVSIDKYNLIGIIIFLIYPIVLSSIAEIHLSQFTKRIIIVSPFILGVALTNLIFNREVFDIVFGIKVTFGFVSFLTIIMKFFLTTLSAMLLIATSGIESIGYALRALKVPRIFVEQFLLMYRYIVLLLEEIYKIWNAYSLRAPKQKGLNTKVWGPLLGQLFLKSYKRANNIYNSMLLRGFTGEYYIESKMKMKFVDIIYLCSWIILFSVFRFFNIPQIIGDFITGVFNL